VLDASTLPAHRFYVGVPSDNTFMSIHSTTLFTAILCVSLVLCGCEAPELKSPAETVVESDTVTLAEEVELEVPEAVTAEEVVPVEKGDPPAAMKTEVSGPMQPMLVVEKKDGMIVVEGFIKSPTHKDRIREQLAEAFPELEIVDNMIVNYDCDAVGWTGRIGNQLLIPYFKEVKDPYIDWVEGVITLKGLAKNAPAQKNLTIMAIDAFTGILTKDINNQLEIVNE